MDLNDIASSHRGCFEDESLLGYYAVQALKQDKFQRYLLLPSS
jgi:hypothetical protein